VKPQPPQGCACRAVLKEDPNPSQEAAIGDQF
jgi:hypothetical protein